MKFQLTTRIKRRGKGTRLISQPNLIHLDHFDTDIDVYGFN